MRPHWLDKWESDQEKQDEEFKERAAIMEYDAGMSRPIAEKEAMKILKDKHPDSTRSKP